MESMNMSESSKKNKNQNGSPLQTMIIEQGSGSSLCSCGQHGLKDSDSMSPAQMQSAGFLAIFSCFVLVEGATRATIQAANVRRFGSAGNNVMFSPAALLVGALLEVVFGVLGLAVSMNVLLYGRVNSKFTLATLCIQLLGWYNFAVFAIANPATADRRYPGLSENQSQFVVACGILGAICYCAILQGGQMFFTWQIWSNHKGNRVNHTVNFYRFWLFVAAGFLLVAGLAQWWIGAVALHAQGNGLYSSSEAIIALPYVVFWPELNVFAGLVVTCGALYAIFNGIFYRQDDAKNIGKVSGMMTYYAPVMLFVWLVQLSCMGFVQASYAGLPPLTAMLTGLSFLISATPVILDSKMRTTFVYNCTKVVNVKTLQNP